MKIEWEPWEKGAVVRFGEGLSQSGFMLTTVDAGELRRDMEEAVQLSAGREKEEKFVEDIDPEDHIYIMGDVYEVTNILEQADGYCIQFTDHTFHEETWEVILPPDKQVTVYVPIR